MRLKKKNLGRHIESAFHRVIKLDSKNLVSPIKIDEVRKIISRKIRRAFPMMIKLDLEDLMGIITQCKKNAPMLS